MTDDTGIVEEGVYELTVAFSGEETDAGDSFTAPKFETEYGLGNNMHVGFGWSRAVVSPEEGERKAGLGEGKLLFKWQFYEGDGTALVLAPAYGVPLSGSSQDRGIIEDVRVLSVPVVGSVESGDWIFTGQVGYDMTSTGPNGVFYGAWVGYSLTDSVELMAEVYREEAVGESEDNTNWRFALTVGVGDNGSLMFGYGGNVSSDLPDDEQFDTDFYIGYLYETG
ncbi:MAG: hypothetical protein CL799_09530 [Chromatiales bacterium]|nr:hypothetical protein [Chromatiales bacterium]MDP6150421.1 hypothetical protein [Gammaproteobacteria bacterium]MDP7271712.1 hypothetical protein [Gammaproteobacteria bacterium]HJP03821.1 hypothetical protein [Gammaproteobacteria bacterium]